MATTPWKTDRWFTSPSNFTDEVTCNQSFADEIEIHDITLRDGEEQVGIVFTYEDRLKIAEALAAEGIRRIELGTLPAASEQDELAMKEIVKRRLGARTFAMTYAGDTSGIKKALEYGLDGIMVGTPSSEYQIKDFEQLSLEEAVDQARESTALAHENGLYTVFFLIDAGRAEINWLLNFVEKVNSAGHVDSLAIADSYGALNPGGVSYLVNRLKEKFDKPIEIHCHNDFGLATANTLAALAAGAKVAHASVLGIGARTGNAPLEDLAVSLLALYNKDIGIKYDRLFETAGLVARLSNIKIPSSRTVLGDMIFKDDCERVGSFIKTHGAELQLEGLFPFTPSLVGQAPAEVLLGKASGIDCVRVWLDKIKMKASDEEAALILRKVSDKAYNKKGLLTSEEFTEISKEVIG